MNNNISWILDLSIKEGKLNDLQSLMEEMVSSIRSNEPGTIDYSWSISEDKNKIQIYEKYQDSDSTLLHLKNFGENFAERFMSNVDVNSLVVYGNPSDELKNALAGFGAVFMLHFGGFSR